LQSGHDILQHIKVNHRSRLIIDNDEQIRAFSVAQKNEEKQKLVTNR
jgi:hypothetical protein